MIRRILIALLVFAAALISLVVDEPVAPDQDKPAAITEILHSREVG